MPHGEPCRLTSVPVAEEGRREGNGREGRKEARRKGQEGQEEDGIGEENIRRSESSGETVNRKKRRRRVYGMVEQ